MMDDLYYTLNDGVDKHIHRHFLSLIYLVQRYIQLSFIVNSCILFFEMIDVGGICRHCSGHQARGSST